MSDRLISLFANVFQLSPDKLDDSSSPDSVAQWDSLKAMRLVAEIEEEFDVELSTVEIMNMDSIGNARLVLKKRGVGGI
jgi:acyl carrier protein